jgi:8-oxo-dGTP pyrophosphatase MutT (NUDIX family)
MLAMRRRETGREYFVFVGGHVETGETVEEALVREAEEEASLTVRPLRLVYKTRYVEDNSEYQYWLCEYLSGEPRLAVDSPEAGRNTNGDQYLPMWLDLPELPRTLLFSLEIRDWVIEDARKNFEGVYREETFVFEKLRKSL